MVDASFFAAAARLGELWWTRHAGVGPESLAQDRLRLLVRHAREHSPLYQALYGGLPDDAPLASLPPTAKPALMARFDHWATDRRITLAEVRDFLSDPARIGEPFLGRYWAWKSSGTSGHPGIFVQDAPAMAVYDALVAAQFEDAPWQATTGLWADGARAALVVATGDHFASIASWERLRRAAPGVEARSFSVLDPMLRLVAALNEYQPAILAGYPSALLALADERVAGRLAIAPRLAWCGGESLSHQDRERIERIFDCTVMDEYGASECLSISHGCREGWQHLHAEWVILEPVDARGRLVAPGKLSHTTLLTNLANWTQPIIRYDLGDRILLRDGPCGCGNPLPAFRVQGRSDDMVALRTRRGDVVRLSPLAVSTVFEDAVGDARFQVAQVGPERLALRCTRPPPRAALEAVHRWLDAQALGNVQLVLDPHPPRADRPSGKVRTVVVEAKQPSTRP